jgi:multidrug efflux pump subunit AcrA (membrane-fusion protein)
VSVPVTTVERTVQPLVYEVVGTVRARVSATVASKLMGTIRKFAVQEGDRVTAGDLLVELDERQVRAHLDQARAALAEAEKAENAAVSVRSAAEAGARQAALAYQRNKALLSGGAVTQETFEAVAARHEQAQAALSRAEAMVDAARFRVQQSRAAVEAAAVARNDARLQAPYDGRVTAKLADEGDLATPGTPLLMLEREDGYRADLAVPETYIRHLHVGQRLEIRIPAAGTALSGTVAVIEPAADRTTRTTTVQVSLPAAASLTSGLFARAALPVGEASAIRIPRTAVVRNGQLTGVFIVDDDNRARFRLVRLGPPHDSAVDVISGLSDGARIVALPSPELSNGSLVEPTS